MTDLNRQAAELEELAQGIRKERGTFKDEVDSVLARERRALDRRLAIPLGRLSRIAKQR